MLYQPTWFKCDLQSCKPEVFAQCVIVKHIARFTQASILQGLDKIILIFYFIFLEKAKMMKIHLKVTDGSCNLGKY